MQKSNKKDNNDLDYLKKEIEKLKEEVEEKQKYD